MLWPWPNWRDTVTPEEALDLIDPHGISVTCTICDRTKMPIGRSVPFEMSAGSCTSECEGHRKDPYPGSLWPMERASEFGYACGVAVDAEAVAVLTGMVNEYPALMKCERLSRIVVGALTTSAGEDAVVAGGMAADAVERLFFALAELEEVRRANEA